MPTYLQLLKRGGRIYLTNFTNGPMLRRSSLYNQVVAEIPRRGINERFPLTRQGIADAFGWLSKASENATW